MSPNNDINKIHLPSIPSQTGSNNNTGQASSQNIIGPLEAFLNTIRAQGNSNDTSKTQGGNGSQENSNNLLGSIVAYVEKVIENFKKTSGGGNTGSANHGDNNQLVLLKVQKARLEKELQTWEAKIKQSNSGKWGFTTENFLGGRTFQQSFEIAEAELRKQMGPTEIQLASINSQIAQLESQNQQQQFNIINPLA